MQRLDLAPGGQKKQQDVQVIENTKIGLRRARKKESGTTSPWLGKDFDPKQGSWHLRPNWNLISH